MVAGIAIGTVIGGWGMLQARKEAVWQPPGTASMGNAPAQVAAAAPAAALPAPAAAPVAALQCETSAIVPRGKEDGREALQPTPSGATASEAASLILTGKEAAASGRLRDAEIAFLNACRNAEAVQARDPVPIADAMYQLGRHYAAVAQSGSGDRKELLERAGRLYTAALQTYRSRYGESGEKTRFASQGLASLQHPAAGKAAPPAMAAKVAPPPVLAKAAPPRPAPAPAPAKAVAPAAPAPEVARVAPPAPAPEVARVAPAPESAAPRQQAARPAETAARRPEAPSERAEPITRQSETVTEREDPVVRAAPPVRRPAPRPVEVEEAPVGPNGAPTAAGSAGGDAAGDAAR